MPALTSASSQRPKATSRVVRVCGSRASLLAAIGLVVLLAAAGPSAAQIPLLPAEVQRVDVIAIEQDQRNLFAFDALTGGRSMIQLELGEDVLFQRSRGRVGLVLTDRRALAAAPGTGFREFRYRIHEQVPEVAIVEDRVAVVLTDRRALGFVTSGDWLDARLEQNEDVVALRAGSAVAVVLTSRRALGLAPDLRRFVAQDLELKEVVESVSAQDTLATVRTNRRILVFSAPRAIWTVQKRLLR